MKFKEAENTAVFTTFYVVVDKRPITYVTHDLEDGAWQFFSDDLFENYEDVARIVALGEIIAIDSTLMQLADMPVGYYACRATPKDSWIIKSKNEP